MLTLQLAISDLSGSLVACLSDPITLREATYLRLLHPNENENYQQQRIVLTSHRG